MKNIYAFLLSSCFALALQAQFTNVQITQCAFGEGSIGIDPNNINRMAGGANIDYFFHSADTGATWTVGTISSSYGVYGDPCIVADKFGNFYYTHLSPGIDRIVIQKSTDGGVTWSNGTYTAYNPPHDADKEWAYYDKNTNTIYVTWAENAYSAPNAGDSCNIKLSKSTDGGLTWSTPVRVSQKATGISANAQKAGVTAVGPAGEVYVGWCGPNGMSFQRSTNGGNTWLAQDIHVDNLTPWWYFTVTTYGGWGTAFPAMACDLSGGPHNGNIYFTWTDLRNGTSNADVFVGRSTDGGNTWTVTKVNNDAGTANQWHSALCVDQSSGNVYVVFYDQRNYPASSQAEIFLAYSTDGGATYANIPITSAPLNCGTAAGDYISVVAQNNYIRPIWSGTSDIEWTCLLKYSQLVGIEDTDPLSHALEMHNYPNPFAGVSTIDYYVPGDEHVTLKVYDVAGKEITTLVDETKSKGWYKTDINGSQLLLSPGIYYLKLAASRGCKVTKAIVIK